MRMRSWLWLIAAIALMWLTPRAEAQELIRLDEFDLYEIRVQGFTLEADAEITVDAVGRWPRGTNRNWSDGFGSWRWSDDEDDNRLSAFAWILDANDREPVWVMDAGDTERFGRSRTLREIHDEIDLPAGDYELYYYSGHSWAAERVERGEHEHWGKGLFSRDDDDVDDIEDDLEDCFVTVETSAPARLNAADGQREDALIRFTQVGDSELRKQGFRMREKGELNAYVLVEHPRDNMDAADFAWIVDVASGEWVWESSSRRGRYAGGGSKNRKFESRILLEAGEYVLYYGSDDSHSFDSFNTNPPYDPLNWGITVSAGEGFSASDLELMDAPERMRADIDFSRVRDDEFFEQHFRLANEADVRVYALGEMDTDGWAFYDYGWIADASSGETVWEMDDRNTYPAGGAEKNRVFDGSVRLPAGDYIAFYVSDDSHSYEDWNAAAPFDEEAWGMTIAASGIQMVEARDVQKVAGVLVSLVRMRDHDRARERFELDDETEVEIYALGEGLDGEMHDYGYIRNRDTGRTIWEMEYRDTDHAGGARKNREQHDTLSLEPGRYEVIYLTDGSHSFEGWNDRRPDDPMSWGIVVRLAR